MALSYFVPLDARLHAQNMKDKQINTWLKCFQLSKLIEYKILCNININKDLIMIWAKGTILNFTEVVTKLYLYHWK